MADPCEAAAQSARLAASTPVCPGCRQEAAPSVLLGGGWCGLAFPIGDEEPKPWREEEWMPARELEAPRVIICEAAWEGKGRCPLPGPREARASPGCDFSRD